MSNIIAEQKKKAKDLQEIRYIDDSNAEFTKTKGGFLAVDYDGVHYKRVSVCPAFPFSSPLAYISLRENTAEGREIGIVKDVDALGASAAKLLHEQINMRCFTPVILKISGVKEEYGFAYFDVDTDRGHCKFAVNISSSDIINLGGQRVIIKDVDGNRFDIPDTSKLSPSELKMIETYV